MYPVKDNFAKNPSFPAHKTAFEVVRNYDFPESRYEDAAMNLITQRDNWKENTYSIAHEICTSIVNQLKKKGEM